MCMLCDEGKPQDHTRSQLGRRDFLKASTATAAAAAGMSLFNTPAGKVRKWKGKLLDVDLRRLRRQLEDSRHFIFAKAGVPQDLYR